MTQLPMVPGVYGGSRPAATPPDPVRTDVCGFVGLEQRIRDAGSTLSPNTHRFAVQATEFVSAHPEGSRWTIPATSLVLSESESDPGLQDGHSRVFAVMAVRDGSDVRLVAQPGRAAQGSTARPPTDAGLQGLLGDRTLRLCNVRVKRRDLRAYVTIEPTLPPVACDDWEAFELHHGSLAPFDGSMLARSVRAFFHNGGTRCHIVTVPSPDPGDAEGIRDAALAMVGIAGAPEREATGLERMLLIEQVAIVAVPDLLARRALASAPVTLPPSQASACFGPCGPTLDPVVVHPAPTPGAPLFEASLVREVQRQLMVRVAIARWRVQLLLSAPVQFDPLTGDFASPTHRQVRTWQASLAGAVGDAGAAATALYHPWLLAADRDGAAPVELPPDGHVAGIFARRDLARGPAIAPANEAVLGSVGPARPMTDTDVGQLYASPWHINSLRSIPGRGLTLWGARTQATDTWMRYVGVRRGLSAIERQVVAAMRPLAFEPNTDQLQWQMTQVALGVLMELFNAGALRGASPDEAFRVRCDESNNPPAQVEVGRVLCEIGVAIAAPAEFVLFRVERTDGAVTAREDA